MPERALFLPLHQNYLVMSMNNFAERLQQMNPERKQCALDTLVRQMAKNAEAELKQQSAETDEIEMMHRLLKQPAWMQAHIANAGHYNNFLRDVRLAWGVAEKAAAFQPEMIGHQVLYALLQTSINSLSSNIHPATLMIGLQTGLWDEETALAYARQVTHGMTKVTILTEIGTFLLDQRKDEQAQEVFIDTLATMREIDHPTDYVQALITLAQHLPQALLTDALAMTQEIADRGNRARVLSAMAPHLSSDLMEEALELIREIGDSDSRAKALLGFAPYLPVQAPHLLSQMLQMVQDLYEGRNQASVLISLAPHLPSHAITEVLNVAQTMYDPCYRAAVSLAFYLYKEPEKRLAVARNALFIARDAHDIEDRAKGIALLAPYLSEELLPEAFTIARTIGDGEPYDASFRTEALVALAPHLSDELQAEMIEEVQKWNIYFFNNCSEVLVALIPKLSQHLFSTMLEAARSIIQNVYTSEKMAHNYPEDQVPRVLVTLFPHLPRELMPDALLAIEDIEAERARGYSLAQIASYLPDELVSKALELVRRLKAVYRVAALTAFSERGFPGLLDEAFRSAQQIQEADESTEILPVLLTAGASTFPLEMRSSVIDEALKISHEIDDARYRAEALIALFPFLPPENCPLVMQEALTTTYSIQEPREEFSILSKLIVHLPSEQWPEVINKALKAIQTDFGEDKQDRTVARVTGMSLLSPFLSREQREEALTAAQKVRDPIVRSLCLAVLAPHFSPVQQSLLLTEALKAARRIKDEERGDRFEALARIALRLPIHQKHDVLVEVLKAAKKVGRMYRSRLGPTLAELFLDLPADLLPSAITLARQIWSPQALTALVPSVPAEERSELLDDALAAVRQVKSGIDRAHMLASLIPFAVPDRQLSILEEALHAIQQLDLPVDWRSFSQVVWSLASFWAQLPRLQAYSLWVPTLRTYAQYRRSYFLAALSGLFQVIVSLGGPPALTDSMNAVLEICCHWSWSYRRT